MNAKIKQELEKRKRDHEIQYATKIKENENLKNIQSELEKKETQIQKLIERHKKSLCKIQEEIEKNKEQIKSLNMHHNKNIIHSCNMCLNWEEFKKQYHATPSSSFIAAHKYLNLPAHIYRTYYELSNDQLDAIFKLCMEYNFVFNEHYSGNPVECKFEFKRTDFYDQSRHSMCKKFDKIGPNFQAWGLGYSTYISLHNREPSSNRPTRFYTEFYKKKMKKTVKSFISANNLPKYLMKLIFTKYIPTLFKHSDAP